MTGIEGLKNYFENIKNYGLNMDIEEADDRLKVTFYDVDAVIHRVSPSDYSIEDHLILNFYGPKRYSVTIDERWIEVGIEHLDSSDIKVERKEIRMPQGVNIGSVSFEGDEYSVEFIEYD